MSIFCYTCHRSFAAGEKEILYDNGSNMAVFQCPTCGIKYLAISDDEHLPTPVLMKLSATKSHVVDTTPNPVPSKIITRPERNLIVTPAQAVAEARALRRKNG